MFRTLLDPLEDVHGDLATMRKSAKMTARISLSFCVLAALVLVVSILSYGVSPSTPFILGLIGMFMSIFFLNVAKQAYISSFLLCVLPSIALLSMTILLKSKSPGDDLHYYDSRIVLVGFCALPGMILSQREPWMLYGAIAISFLCLALYDPIHEWLGLGYYQGGFTNPTYYHINTISLVICVSIIAGSLMLKGIVLKEEDKNAELLQDRHLRNLELETQNEEIVAQTEQLTAAFNVIETQKKQLELHAIQLEETVRIKSKDLQRSNEELQKYNSELRQFSYTVSHNLRGPVARLLGLTGLIDITNTNLSKEDNQIVSLIRESSEELDTIIRELSRIIDIRNELYTVKEKTFFEEEWTHVQRSLAGQILPDMFLEKDFSNAPFMYTIRPFLHSILYNLVSNAIRYRSPQRRLHVKISTTLKTGIISITVADNGLGINLDQFGNNLFGMYKRFHTHVEGRGLGLYLVKTQVEALQGTIRVESELNRGTTFHIDIKLPADIEGQVCFECDFGSILYNARINTMGLTWKRAVRSEEYRLLLTKCLEMLHVYSTPRWIVDLRKRGTNLTKDDYTWLGESIINEGSQNGLRRIACIDQDHDNGVQRSELIRTSSRFGVQVEFFSSRNEAETWIEE